MPTLIFAFGAAALGRRYLQLFAPSNALVARVRRRRPRLRIIAGLLALSLTLAAGALLLAGWVTSGGPEWLNLVVLVAIWDAMKFAWVAVFLAFRPPRIRRTRRMVRSPVTRSTLGLPGHSSMRSHDG